MALRPMRPLVTSQRFTLPVRGSDWSRSKDSMGRSRPNRRIASWSSPPTASRIRCDGLSDRRRRTISAALGCAHQENTPDGRTRNERNLGCLVDENQQGSGLFAEVTVCSRGRFGGSHHAFIFGEQTRGERRSVLWFARKVNSFSACRRLRVWRPVSLTAAEWGARGALGIGWASPGWASRRWR